MKLATHARCRSWKRRRLVALLCTVMSCMPPAAAQTPPAAEVVQRGTYASDQLQEDTMLGVFGLLGADGCEKITDVFPYLREPPVGPAGARHWGETWVVQCSNGIDEVDIDFQETADGGADYSIPNRTRPQLTR